MTYDGEGQIIQWIIVTERDALAEEFITSGEFDVLFLKTNSGCINSTVVKNAMIMIAR